jgi:putative ABC transport system permease protein
MLTHALKSLWNRRFVAVLTILSVALSVALIVGVERLRDAARESFTDSASGLDLIVAARGNPVQILLATVFGVGSTGQAIGWDSFEMVEALPGVAWAVPISMGDNHRGFPVIGTTAEYFEHFRHSGGQALRFGDGGAFAAADGAVVGAEVAARFGYAPGTVIVNAHGAGRVAFDVHDEAPFRISGVLAPTGTAVDRMVLVSLAGFDALHARPETPPEDPFATAPKARASPLQDGSGYAEGDADQEDDHRHGHTHPTAARAAGTRGPSEHSHDAEAHDHAQEPARINAVYVGLTDRTAVLSLQRTLSRYRGEPLTAVLPNLALLELWTITGTTEAALRLMAWAVALAGLLGMVVMLSATIEARRREFAILRSVGANPARIFGLIVIEAAILSLAGILTGIALAAVATTPAEPLLAARFGIRLAFALPRARELALLVAIFCAGLLASLVPAARVYRTTVADGLTVRL